MTRNSTCLESPVVTRTEPSLESTWTRARPLTVYDLVHSSALAAAAAKVLARTARAAKPANRPNSLLGLPFEKGRAVIVVYASVFGVPKCVLWCLLLKVRESFEKGSATVTCCDPRFCSWSRPVSGVALGGTALAQPYSGHQPWKASHGGQWSHRIG